MFKRNVFKILAIVFFLLSGATFLYSNNSTKQIVKKPIKPFEITQGKPTLTAEVLTKAGSNDNVLGDEDSAPTKRLNPSISPTQIIIQPTNTPVPTQIPTPYTLPTTTSLTVSLSIGESSVGSFEIPQGSNQCDLLTQALSQGKIQSLNMRYNNDMGTNAVYQINGIGKENAVWWGFKVNGQSPSQGCSYIKVNNGDSVLWEYVGS